MHTIRQGSNVLKDIMFPKYRTAQWAKKIQKTSAKMSANQHKCRLSHIFFFSQILKIT